MEERYQRNIPAISEEEQLILQSSRVAVAGCGGLGGHIIDCLARIGIGNIKVIDCDEFSVSNLNRQLISKESNIGKRKAEEAALRIKEVNSSINVTVVDRYITEENASEIFSDADLVIDALDNVKTRLLVERVCEEKGIYFIHGAVSGWNAQASTIKPGSRFLEKIYSEDMKLSPPPVLSFIPDFAASIEVAEAIKVLLKREDTLEGKLLIADLSIPEIHIINLV